MFRSFILVCSLLILAPQSVLADTLLLVPGYRGSVHSWRGTGITVGLHRNGWRDAGHLTMSPQGVLGPRGKVPGLKRFYTLDIPTEAPILVQSDFIANYVAHVQKRRKKERVILVGHSAGGVVSRLAMVRYPQLKIYGLVTIASPHLGSRMADFGRTVSNSPLSWMAPFMGANTINRSRALYHDLGREGPHNILGWLNRVRHPKARYISVIRTKNGHPARGDGVSVGWRQDMRMVPALKGRARSYMSIGDHALRPSDSIMIAQILSRLK